MPKMTKQMGKALAANIVYPGAGHFFLKKWIRAGLFTLATIIAMLWLLFAFVACILGVYYKAAKGEEFHYNYIYLILPFIAIFILWVYSYIDLFFFCKIPDDPPKKDKEQ